MSDLLTGLLNRAGDIHSRAIEPADAALHQAVRGDPRRGVVVTEMWSDD